MALKKCPECKKKISTHAPSCPKCGLPLKKDWAKSKESNWFYYITVPGAIILLFYYLAGGDSPTETEPSNNKNLPLPTASAPPSSASPPNSTPDIVADRFDVNTTFQAPNLKLSVKSDLPDNTILMVSVFRRYSEKDGRKYVIPYLNQKATLFEWRSPRLITVDNKRWLKTLITKRISNSRLGIGSPLAHIDNKIIVSFIVPTNQANPRFGKGNKYLTGKAIKISNGLRIIEHEQAIDYPAKAFVLKSKPYGNLDPQNLSINKGYVLSKETPLMRSPNPTDHMSALAKVKYAAKGSVIDVIKSQNIRGNRWYKVDVLTLKGNYLGEGWIDSTALLSQKLKSWQ
jgi:hypothetical protein